jgi:hypothetical protein
MIGELVIGITLFLIFSYQDRTSVNTGSTTINFYTDQDFILIIFDSNENSFSKFNKKERNGKELNVYNTNIIHLDSSVLFEKGFRINYPKHWGRFSESRSTTLIEGDSIGYIYSSKNILNTNYIKDSDAFIDSLLKLEKRK